MTLGSLVLRLRRRLHGCRRRWYRWRLVLVQSTEQASVQIGRGVTFNVPVRGSGQGVIRIGDGTCLGQAAGFRLGSGEVSLYTATAQAEIVIGRNGFLNNNVSIGAVEKVVVGDDCLIGACVSIADCDFHDIDPKTRRQSQGPTRPVIIGQNVWLGTGVAVLKGVTIGDNSVVGTMSVVTKSIPANCVAAGNPARVVRSLA